MKVKIIVISALAVLLALLVFFANKTVNGNNKAVKAYNKGNFEEAADILKKEIEAEPYNYDIINNAAASDYKIEDLDAAAAKYNAVLNSASAAGGNIFDALYGLGNIEYQNENFERAADYYKKALKINPEDFDAKYNLEAALSKMRGEGEGKSQPEEKKENKQNRDKKQQEDLKKQADENRDERRENEEKMSESESKEQEAKNKEEESRREKDEAKQRQEEIEKELNDLEDKNDGQSQKRKEELRKELEEQKQKEKEAAEKQDAAKAEQEKQKKERQALEKEKQELEKQKQELNGKIEAEKNKQKEEQKKQEGGLAQEDLKEPEKDKKETPASVFLDYFDEADKNSEKLRNKMNKTPVLNQPEEDW